MTPLATPPAGWNPPGDPRPAAAAVVEAPDDRLLREHIERALRAPGYRALTALAVSVRRRRVTLRGRLPNYYLRQLAQAAVRSAPGVCGLCDEVAVAPPA